MPIKLPKKAFKEDYEDQIFALLLSQGYYIERRLVLKKGSEEILEFDAVATPANDCLARKVVEVKSGQWGASDIFKLYGQVIYRGESEAWLIFKKENSRGRENAFDELLKDLSISTFKLDPSDESYSGKISPALEIPEKIRKVIFENAWWAQLADRVAQQHFRKWRKNQANSAEIVKQSKDYIDAVADSFFQPSPGKRVDALYSAYRDCPKLSSNLIRYVSEISGESLSNVRRTAWDNCKRPFLQYVMAEEYRARIAIIKNAYDAIREGSILNELESSSFSANDILINFQPESFIAGMRALKNFPFSERIPFFYQIFVEVFGGFYLTRNDQDMESLSNASGIPVSHISDALNLFNKFFPIEKGWIHTSPEICFLKSIPAYLRGAGCFTRQDFYGENWVDDLPVTPSCVPDWHNALYELLEPSFKVDE